MSPTQTVKTRVRRSIHDHDHESIAGPGPDEFRPMPDEFDEDISLQDILQEIVNGAERFARFQRHRFPLKVVEAFLMFPATMAVQGYEHYQVYTGNAWRQLGEYHGPEFPSEWSRETEDLVQALYQQFVLAHDAGLTDDELIEKVRVIAEQHGCTNPASSLVTEQ